MPSFTCDLGIWAHVLLLVQQILNQQSPSYQALNMSSEYNTIYKWVDIMVISFSRARWKNNWYYKLFENYGLKIWFLALISGLKLFLHTFLVQHSHFPPDWCFLIFIVFFCMFVSDSDLRPTNQSLDRTKQNHQKIWLKWYTLVVSEFIRNIVFKLQLPKVVFRVLAAFIFPNEHVIASAHPKPDLLMNFTLESTPNFTSLYSWISCWCSSRKTQKETTNGAGKSER